jgi:hypothetical protein
MNRRTARFCVVALLALVGAIGPTPTAEASNTALRPAVRLSGIAARGDTRSIVPAEQVVVDGWRYERFVNLAYPCSTSGHQSFVIGTRDGSSSTVTAPLWVKMRGGGAGWFDVNGNPLPNKNVKSEESFDTQLRYDTDGLMADVKAAPQNFRILIVSMCSHDIYGGVNTLDPNNPHMPGGAPATTNGLISTKAAIQFTTRRLPTDDFFLHGTSAGGVGSFHVAWGLQRQGLAPAGVVSDSGVLNQAWQRYVSENGVPGATGCEKTTIERGDGVVARIAPEVSDPANEPHLLVGDGRLAVPVMHVWNRGDVNVCGSTPIQCPLPDDTAPILPAATCNHEPMRRAIASLGPASRSLSFGVCVEGNDTTAPCDRHVVTTMANGINTDPTAPADYQQAILDWVVARLADD